MNAHQEKAAIANKRLEIATQIVATAVASGKLALQQTGTDSLQRAVDESRKRTISGAFRLADELIAESGWEPQA